MQRFERLEFWTISLSWSILLMLPAIMGNQIAGSPWTDLYPSVWSLWATEDWWMNWNTRWLNHPSGQNWTPNSILWGTIIIPLKSFFSMGSIYNGCLGLSRWLGCAAWYLVGKSIGGSHNHGLLWMICISMHPMIHGFAVEGIFEGTQIWALGFSLLCIKNQRSGLQILFGLLVIMSNWYWALLWGLIGLIAGFKDRRIWANHSIAIILGLPWILHFIDFSSGAVSITPEILRSMGLQFAIPTPNITTPDNPFAMTNYVGWIFSGLMLAHTRISIPKTPLILIIIGVFLSIGIGWSIPILSSIRFPYRLHLLTMIGAVWWISSNTKLKSTIAKVLLYGIICEQLFLSPIDWIIPTTSKEVPEYVAQIDGPILEIPGPLYRPPGEFNPSRSRMKQVLYYQTMHNQPSGWKLDFNGLQPPSDCFFETRILDPQAEISEITESKEVCWSSIEWIVVHNSNTKLDSHFEDLGFVKLTEHPPILWRKGLTSDD